MAPRQAVIFDWGGVFLQTEDYSYRHRWDARLGLPQGSVEQALHGSEDWKAAQRGNISLETYLARSAAQLGIDQDEIGQLWGDFYKGDRLAGDVVESALMARRNGMQIGLLSNNVATLRADIDRLGIAHLFDEIVISAEIGIMKPYPQTYLTILERMGKVAAASVFIDDVLENIEGARQVGMLTIHYVQGCDMMGMLQSWLESG